MQEKGIINTNQFVWLLFILIASITSMQIPGMLITQAGRDAWLSVIGGWFLDVMLALVYAYMGIRFPGQNFVQYSMTILGKNAGKIVGSLFPLFFLVVCTILMRGLSQLMNLFFLPRTSLELILAAGLFVAAYAARQGIEVIARVTELMGPLFIISIISIGLFVLPHADIKQLKPQLAFGVAPFLVGSPLLLIFFGICIMMAMFIPLCNRPENGFLGKFIAVSLGAVFVSIIVVSAVAVFGYAQAKNMYAPGLELSRMIVLGRFFERVEIIWMMLATGAGIIASAQLLWAFSLGISQILDLSTYKPLVYPAALLTFMLSWASFNTHMDQMSFVHYTFPLFAAFTEAGLEIFLFIAALVLHKRG
jgi:spore germination protein (amino acid permease)